MRCSCLKTAALTIKPKHPFSIFHFLFLFFFPCLFPFPSRQLWSNTRFTSNSTTETQSTQLDFAFYIYQLSKQPSTTRKHSKLNSFTLFLCLIFSHGWNLYQPCSSLPNKQSNSSCIIAIFFWCWCHMLLFLSTIIVAFLATIFAHSIRSLDHSIHSLVSLI